jgi:hypothetical protein
MKKNSMIQKMTFCAFLAIISLIACNKDGEENPVAYEAINLVSPDSTTIFALAGEVVDFTLYLAIDQPIDTIRGAFLVDTSMSMIQSLSFSDMDSTFYVQGFADSQNVQTVSGTFTMPLGVDDSIPFRSYFSGSSSPFIAPDFDAIRIIFRMEAADNTIFEKQLKIIVK